MQAAKAYRFVTCGAMAVFAIAVVSGHEPARTAPYTLEQANAGRATYQAKCATCHLPDLKGSNEAPPLAGGNFVNTWRNRAVSDLFDRIRNTMPLSNPGSLGEQETLSIVAYLLQMNGATAGNQTLTPGTLVPIGSVIAAGAPPQAAIQNQENAPAPARTTGAP